MSEEYSLEIVNPEKSFLLKDDVTDCPNVSDPTKPENVKVVFAVVFPL